MTFAPRSASVGNKAAMLLALSAACGPESVLEDYAYSDGPWLTWDGDPATTMTISWITPQPGPSTLSWGLAPDALVELPGGDDEVRVHHVRLAGLSPDTRYYYRIPVAFETDHGTELFSFRTAPTQTRPYRIGIVGDMQPRDEVSIASNLYMSERLVVEDVDLWVQLGDMAQEGAEVDSWHEAMRVIARTAAFTPFMPVIGNHDARGDGGENWRELFPVPLADPASGWYYSFDFLDAHLIMVDNVEESLGGGLSAAQLAWLDAELSAARADGKWVFVFMHIALMSTATENMNYAMQEQLVPMFARHAVDGVFFAHDHMYEHYEYTYGGDGLVYEPEHGASVFPPVHYWVSGGGGAWLENEYGLTTNGHPDAVRTFYDVATGTWVERVYGRRPWNPERFVASAEPEWSPSSPNYFHDCARECYQDDAVPLGHDYGENTLHYMLIEIDGDTCTVSARYPDGSIISGPAGDKVQSFTFTRP